MSQSLAAPSSVEVTEGFAALLRERTKLVHRAAERAGFIADLLHGRATKTGYSLFLRNLQPAYAELEAALSAEKRSPLAGAFADPRLHRLTSLQSDLHALCGEDWTSLPVLPAAKAYAAAIAAVRDTPGGLVAHAYARYLGDLSGGQILSPLLARTLGLGSSALAFYAFPGFLDLSAPKVAIRAALDTVPIGSPVAEAICEEAVAAFRHNIAVSEAVQASLASS